MSTATPTTARKRRGPTIVTRVLALIILAIVLAVAAWAVWGYIGYRSASQTTGVLRIPGVLAPLRIVRDRRDIPHVRAANEHDLYFAQGYAEASDRLFQMDLLRRYVYGTLAEVLGPAVLPADENARVCDIAGIVARQWNALDARDRADLVAFSDGANAAMAREPLPVEFHLLLYRPQRWTPQDSLAVGMATALDLIDPWDDVIRRDAVAHAPGAAAQLDLYSITDPHYDAPIAGRPAPVPPLGARSLPRHAQRRVSTRALPPQIVRGGSNEWAVGADHSLTGRALLANDPHLRLAIPGVWYLVDLQAPGLHMAGASLAGTPGIVLGHNDDVAWGATNGTVVTEVVYRDSIADAKPRHALFHVRFGRDVIFTYYTTAHGFVAERHGKTVFAVDWHAFNAPATPLRTFSAIDRAHSVSDALRALRTYPGPPQNFVLADRSGAAAYQLAGLIPRDPFWGLRVHPHADPHYPFLPFSQLPHVAPARSAVVFTANNRMYGAGYPYRLTANFAAPYRAYRIEHLLHAHKRFGVEDFAAFQRDTLSLPDRDVALQTVAAARRLHLEHDRALAPYLRALGRWDGRFDPGSRGAAIAWETRRNARQTLTKLSAGSAAAAYTKSADNADLVLLMRVLRDRPRGWCGPGGCDRLLIASLRNAIAAHGTKMLQPWGEYGAVTIKHPLSTVGFSFLNGAQLPGNGDAWSIHVQKPAHSQSFRAVWDVGNWDAGGIVIPSGESGQPGSGHYTDLSKTWIDGKLVPLPYSDRAVRANAVGTLTLLP